VKSAPGSTWVLSDGAAGNENQARALASALGATPEVFRLRTRAPWRWFAPRWVPANLHAYSIDAAAPWPALAIGCGRQAALALRTLKRLSPSTRTVQILDPRIDPSAFDLIIAPAHDRLAGPNVIATRGAVHGVDASWLARARVEFAPLGALPGPRTSLLLGGSTGALHLDRKYWRGLAAKLGHWLTRDGGSLLVTTSRRSPDWLREAARAEFSAVPGVQWHGPDDGPNPYAGLLAWADRIVVTPDSVNLLSEACATGVPVLCHFEKPLRGKLAHFYRDLLEAGRVRPMKLDYQAWEVQPLREIEAVAARARAHLGL
jgi:mitochondrial fission protein ELM1